MTSSEKHTVLITGAAKRIGRDLALMFAKDGHDIILHYNSSEEDAKNTAKEIEAFSVKCTLVQADLTDHQQVMQLLNNVPTPDILINNASAFEKCTFMQTSESVFDQYMNLQVKAPFFLSQQFAKKAGKGNIINITDTYINTTTGVYFAYLLSKKSLYELTPMIAKELAPNIRVNAVALGLTEYHDNINDEYIEERKKRLPISEEVTITEIYKTMMHFIDTPSITGECILLDNGAHLL